MALVGTALDQGPYPLPGRDAIAGQGLACSNTAARARSLSSRPNPPANWIPIGKPPALHANGSDIAGWPVQLNTAVNGATLNTWSVQVRAV
jgi:hypothetical protein